MLTIMALIGAYLLAGSVCITGWTYQYGPPPDPWTFLVGFFAWPVFYVYWLFTRK